MVYESKFYVYLFKSINIKYLLKYLNIRIQFLACRNRTRRLKMRGRSGKGTKAIELKICLKK